MKHLVSKEEIEDIKKELQNREDCWINSSKDRKEQYQRILREGSILEVILMLRTIENKRIELNNQRKKLSSYDVAIYQEGRKLLEETLSYVLQLPKEEAYQYLLKIDLLKFQ